MKQVEICDSDKKALKSEINDACERLLELEWGQNGLDEFEGKMHDIGNVLLNHHFKVGETEIYPIWIEAYYCNPEKGYVDMTMDAAKERTDDKKKPWPKGHGQVDHFGQFYFSSNKGYHRRVDLVFSSGNDYALSFLLKGAIVKAGKSVIMNLSYQLWERLMSNETVTLEPNDGPSPTPFLSECLIFTERRLSSIQEENERATFGRALQLAFYRDIEITCTRKVFWDAYKCSCQRSLKNEPQR